MKRQSETSEDRGQVFDPRIEASREAMIRYAQNCLGEHFSRSDAEDAVQVASLEAWRDLPSLRDPNALSAWLRRLTFKQCDRLRRARRMTVPVDEGGETTVEIPDPAPDPGSRLAAAEENAVQQRMVRIAIRSLPKGERIAVLLYYWGGGSCHDLAAFLGISTTALKSRLHSARRRLKERIPAMEPTTANSEPLPLLSDSPEALTETERSDLLRKIEACYARFTDTFEVLDPFEVLPLLTEDYELIFPQEMNEPIWDKARVEQDIRKAGIRPPGRFVIRVILDGLLSVERDPVTRKIVQATTRATFISTWSPDKPPHVRIDTFALVGTEWKFRRTLSLGHEK
ncbi:MAG: RNA polymerase sigma factor [Cytophagales bacterium]|nr:RNA polymerase sigma factor [Armatimonadota bacterium]